MTGWLMLVKEDTIEVPGSETTVELFKDRPIKVHTKTLKNQPSQERIITFTVRFSNLAEFEMLIRGLTTEITIGK